MDHYYDIDDDVLGDAPYSLEDEIPNRHDVEMLDKLISDLTNYDVLDFISRISSLNLIPYNQNKGLLFDKIIDHILRSQMEFSEKNNIMSPKRFKQFVDSGKKLSVAMGIDPPEMPFIQRVLFYGNKWIFSGTNYTPAYILQNIVDVLRSRANQFDNGFVIVANRIVHFVLDVSTRIVEKMNYDNSVFAHHETSEIVYPQSKEVNNLVQAIIFDEEDYDNIFDDELRKIVYYSKTQETDIELDYESCTFYYHPFLKIDANRFLVLNPSMLVPFAVYHILRIATEHGYRNDFVDLYNNKTWYECKQSLITLQHKKISGQALGIELLDTDFYKEAVFSAYNDGILFVRYFCDNAQNYNFSNMFATTTIDVDAVENRWKILLDLDGVIKKDKIYQLIIINSIGRGVRFGFREEVSQYHMTLSPFELFCISINERNHSDFLLHYMESKKRLYNSNITSIAEMNYLAIYTENQYSFYFNDETDSRTTILFPGYGDSVDYLNKALLAWDKQYADIPGSDYYREIVLNDEKRNIYCTIDKQEFVLMNRFKNLDLWVTADLPSSVEELNIIRSVLDLLTYWFSECKKIVEKNRFKTKSILVKNYFNGEPKDYYLANNIGDYSISDYLSYEVKGGIVNIYWSPKAFLCLATGNNSPEKELMKWVFSNITCFSEDEFDIKDFDIVFANPLKTKVFAIDYIQHPYFKPILERVRHIPVEYEHEILDEIGDYLRNNKQYPYGVINGIEKHVLCKDIVSFLYEKLKCKVAEFNPEHFYEILHFDLEVIIYSMMLAQKRYSYDIACYPERSEKIDSDYNEINKNSIATKFLLEYIAAVPPSGILPLGEGDYEYMLTLCSLIIEWAHNSDMFLYKMMDNDLEILQSGRIGLKKERIEELVNNNYIASRKRLNAISNPSIDLYSPQDFGTSDELDLAFEDEFSYKYSELVSCIFEIISIGDTIKGEVKRKDIDFVCDEITSKQSLSKEKALRIISDLTLSKREDYLKPPSPFKPNDVYPWKFNRRLSFIRRPITLVDRDLIWGNRQVYHSLRYINDLILNGRLPVRDHGKMKKYLSKLVNAKGNDFNDVVAAKLKEFGSFIVERRVKKINKKTISDQNGNDLGDIDVLVIIPSKRKIVVIEVKDFSFAKTPYEMHQQYLSIFRDDGNKLSYITRHKKRVAWIKEHLSDVIACYKLDEGKWKVTEALVVDDSIVSNEFYHQNQTIILYSELTEDAVKRIK